MIYRKYEKRRGFVTIETPKKDEKVSVIFTAIRSRHVPRLKEAARSGHFTQSGDSPWLREAREKTFRPRRRGGLGPGWMGGVGSTPWKKDRRGKEAAGRGRSETEILGKEVAGGSPSDQFGPNVPLTGTISEGWDPYLPFRFL